MLQVKNIAKSFSGKSILESLSLELAPRQMLSILGRSGCGKTTLLKIIAGLVQPDAGEIFLDQQAIQAIPPHRRNMVYLYQEALLFPHLNVFENVAFGLRLQKKSATEIQERTQTMLADLELSDQSQKMPHQLSGGQKQRVAFGRALIINPPLLLLDEPFGNLDPETRQSMQQLLKKIMTRYQTQGIFVTHDLKEAILMGDQIALMQAGNLKTYAQLEDFLQDPHSHAQAEMDFWQKMEALKMNYKL